MVLKSQSKAKEVSIMAMVAALFVVFFYLSKIIALPTFTFLYLPIILLGVIPIWFGWGGLVGSMIGAYIGGVYVETLPLHLAWVEVTTVLVIYLINWLLIPRFAAEAKTLKRSPRTWKRLCPITIRWHSRYSLAIRRSRIIPR